VAVPTSAIRVRHVTRRFDLFASPRQRLTSALGIPPSAPPPVFTALDDVSFDVSRGSTVGIIGRNGSGKSTLLQIICGILQPTSGEVQVEGNVSAILDLGGGFNPELTGRENVRLRGAVLGRDRYDVERHLGDIEQFADIGPFFDRPVKIYSSGMYVRLAFAAAINADPDILIVDEALAVGDARFQHKCFQRIGELREHGKTIVIVTHNTEAVVRHCDHVYLLEAGAIVEQGRPAEIVNSYLELLFTGRLSTYVTRQVRVDAELPGFDVLQFGRMYYALASSSAPIDLERLREDELIVLERAGKLVRGGILADVKARAGALGLVGRSTPARAGLEEVEHPSEQVTRFLDEAIAFDGCTARHSFNPHERRIGDRRGRIVDYLIASATGTDLFTVNTGDTVHVYIKAHFVESVQVPMFGLSLKTKDGIVVHASNSRYSGLMLDPVKRDDVVVFEFSLTCILHPGDYFLDLGLAEMRAEIDVPVDIRYGLVHLVVQSASRFDGLVNLGTSAREAKRLTAPSQKEPA
jgi:homopolymeric O-antigen transport system ATP-binding protein